MLAARPDRLCEVRPQPGVLRHTGAHFVDFSPFVQIHDFPEPQMEGEQVVEFMKELDAPALDERPSSISPDSSTLPAPSTAESRTVGGGADDHFLLFFTAADCRAAHRRSSSS